MQSKIHKNQYQSKADVPNKNIVGVWVKRYSFSLRMGGNGIVNAMESYTFRNDGIAEYYHNHDSGIQKPTSWQYTYEIDGNRLILISEFEDDLNYFEIVGNRLILTDKQYNLREEFVFQPMN